MQEQTRTIKQGGVVVATNIKKVKEMINVNGQVIDPVTKEVIEQESK